MTDRLFAVVLAAHNVERYIAATLRSLDTQTLPADQLEVIIVDDGSTDGTLELARRWAEGKPHVRIIAQENQGVGGARKVGFAAATAEWITVVDPDDILDREYFAAMRDFLADPDNRACDMLVTRVMILNDTTGRLHDTHPLKFRFRLGNRLVSLDEEPSCIQLGATAAVRRTVLEEHGLTYDPRIKPTFEDAHLLGRYLATSENPKVGVVAAARYYYRRRNDSSSLVQSSWALPSRYTTVLRLGYLALLEEVQQMRGHVPKWTQHMVLYDLAWYFKEEAKQQSRTAWISGEIREEFVGLLREIFKYIDIETIREFSVNPMSWALRETLVTYFKSDEPRLFQWNPERSTGWAQYSVLFRGEEPDLRITVNGEPYEPRIVNHTVHTYFGVDMMVERSFTISQDGQTQILFGSEWPKVHRATTPVPPARLVVAPPKKKVRAATPSTTLGKVKAAAGRRLDKASVKAARLATRFEVESLTLDKPLSRAIAESGVRTAGKIATKVAAKVGMHGSTDDVGKLKRLAASPAMKSKYRNAWIVMDRPQKADDNGEHLYRYLLRERPDINAYFLLERTSPDWDRLEAEGFNLVAYGSDEAFCLVLNAKFRISSDAVSEVMYPVPRRVYNYAGSKFVFLQHGVIMNDLSRWLNPKKIDAMVSTTWGEYEALTGPRSPYRIHREQTLLTGLARYDALYRLRHGADTPRDTLLVMPTWRQQLRDILTGAETPGEAAAAFAASDFGRHWLEFLSSPALRDLAAENGLEITFMPHPSLAPFVQQLTFPDHVRLVDPAKEQFQSVLSRSRILVTDYSSTAFDAAMLDIPVVYYQFDADEVFGGGASYRRGYFDYSDDGFGPVVTDLASTLGHVAAALAPDAPEALDEYRRRAAEAFVHRDDQNCRRTVEAIEALASQ